MALLYGQLYPYSIGDGTQPSAGDSFQLWCDGSQHTGPFNYYQIFDTPPNDYDFFGYLSVSATLLTIGETCTFKLITGGNTYTTSDTIDIDSETVAFGNITPTFSLPSNPPSATFTGITTTAMNDDQTLGVISDLELLDGSSATYNWSLVTGASCSSLALTNQYVSLSNTTSDTVDVTIIDIQETPSPIQDFCLKLDITVTGTDDSSFPLTDTQLISITDIYIYGCMDENACNYNEFATAEINSCEYPSDELSCGCSDFQQGDFNLDCQTDIVDIVNLVEIVVNHNPMTEQELLLCDLNNDGVVNVVDLVMIVQIIIGVILNKVGF